LKTLLFDGETSIKNKGNPFTHGNFLVSFGWGFLDSDHLGFTYYRDADFLSSFTAALAEAEVIVGVNIKFDIHWLRKYNIVIPEHVRVWDCSIAEFILSGQKSVLPSMDKMCDLYGLPNKQGGLEEYWNAGISTEDIPYDIVKGYQLGDIERTKQIFKAQQADTRLHKTPNLEKLIYLDGDDLLVLQDMEYNGIKYDISNSISKAEVLEEEARTHTSFLLGLSADPSINFGSPDQLSAFLFGGEYEVTTTELQTMVYKSGPRKGEEYTRNVTTERIRIKHTGYFNPPVGSELAKSTAERPVYSTADGVLSQLRCVSKFQRRIIESLQRLTEIEKLTGTYLRKLPKLIEDMKWGEYLHGQFNQTIAATGRLSSSKPNMQNSPPISDQMLITRW
jgi:DNA polymerase I-like protein with 3'-5' exonuclease and polymerase domains